MNIYEFREYKPFIMTWIESQPKKGHGLARKIADKTKLSQAMLSQILKGEKHFSAEAAYDVGDFMGLNEEEMDYFLLLLNYSRAGTYSLRERYRKKILMEQKRNNDLSKRMKPDGEFNEVAKGVFYSHWLYTGIRNMTACPSFKDIDKIASHLNLPRQTVQRTLDFLLENGLCVMNKGKLDVGPQITHIGNQTSLVGKHHQNWRLHGMSKIIENKESDLFFTSPMSLSADAADLIRQKIPAFVEQVRKIVGPSDSEVVKCLNIDWFSY